MATNPYTTQTIVSYNSSPPADDGTVSAANKVNWSKHKTKLADPVKTLSEAINTQLLTSFGKVVVLTADESSAMAGSLSFTESTVTLATDAFAATRSAHIVAAQSGTTDDLKNITTASVADNAILIIRPDAGDTITVKDAATGAGEIHLINSADLVMSGDDTLILQMRTPDWYEMGRTGIVAATQALQEAAASLTTAVTPGTQQYHPSAAKVWIDLDGTGTVTNDASYNVTSVTDTAQGTYTITIATDLSDANYCVALGGSDTGDVTGATGPVVCLSSRAVGSCVIKVYRASSEAIADDIDPCCVAIFGDL